MSKTAISQYSSTPSSNSDVDGIDISEGCPASNLNNAQRSLMSHLKEMDDGTSALTSPSMGQLNVDNLRLDGNTISSTDTNGNVQIDPAGTGVVAVVGTLQSDGLTVDGDVTLNDGSPNLRLQDSDVSRYIDMAYGTRAASFTNTMASGEDIDTVEPWYSFRFADDGETREVVKIDHDGIVTKPLQPSFMVYKASNDQNNFAAGNASVVVTWPTEAFDIGSNFASNTFTAPVTGKYLLTAKLRVSDVDNASQYYILKLVTSNGDCFDLFDSNVYSSDLDFLTLQVTTVQDMDANDTAQVQITQQGGTAQSGILGSRHYSNFSGYLLG